MVKNSSKTTETATKSDNIYTVERIIQKRVRRGKKEYLIKWKDYDIKDSTWEPASNVSDDVIQEFKDEEKFNKTLNSTKLSKEESTWEPKDVNQDLKKEDKFNKPSDETPIKDALKVKDFLEHGEECNDLIPEKIIGATEMDSKLVFLLKFENSKQIYLIQSKIANVKYPQVVIQFYEQHYTFID